MLLFILDIVVSVGLSVANNIHFGEMKRGWCVSDVSTVNALCSYFPILRQTGGQIWKFFSLKPSSTQGELSLKISAHLVWSFQRS